MEDKIVKVKDNNKKKLIIGIVFIIIILMGSTYAFFTYSKTSGPYIITSNRIRAEFESGTNIALLANAYPISDSYALNNLSNLKYIDFTINGEASNQDESIDYEIYLTEEEGNTLSNNYIKIYITDNNGNSVFDLATNAYSIPKIYGELKKTTYAGSSNGKIVYKGTHVGTFSKHYRLYFWLDSSYDQNEESQTFDFKVNLYAYNGIAPISLAKNIIDNYQLGTTEGLVAIDTNGDLVTNASQTIREYRYSGNTVDNYVRFSNTSLAEVDKNWRIIGVFLEDQKDNTGNWIVKLTRETPLDSSELTNVPGGASTRNETTGGAYWNTTKTGLTFNDWSTATLQKYLNSASEYPNDYYLGRLSSISEKIKTNANYYMGEVTYSCAAKNCYNQERKTGTISWSDNNIHGNNMIWNGAIGLMYASDYLYAGANSNWRTVSSQTSVKNNNWIWNMDSKIQTNPSGNSNTYWFISPHAWNSDAAMHLNGLGYVNTDDVFRYQLAVRPVLNLESGVSAENGTGTINSKFVIN